MKKIFFILVLSYTSFSFAEFCNWGFAGPEIFKCNGENYYYGTAACQSGMFANVFCHERYNNDGPGCYNDNSAKTVACYREMMRARSQPPPPEKEGFCNWGFMGPERVSCEGQNFCFGTAACENKVYSNIFCREENCNSGKKCADDNADITARCFDAFVREKSNFSSQDNNSSKKPGVR